MTYLTDEQLEALRKYVGERMHSTLPALEHMFAAITELQERRKKDTQENPHADQS